MSNRVVGTRDVTEGKMFDKLIESNSEEAEFKNRRSYFVVSTIVVGVLFLAAVVASIYAGNIGIGNGDLEMSELLAPVEMAAMTPEERPQQHTPQNQNQQTTETTRVVNQQTTEEMPTAVPPISTVANNYLSHPDGRFIVDGLKDSGPSSAGTGRDSGTDPSGTGLSHPDPRPETTEAGPEVDPPSAIQPPKPRSLGVINGMATSLPKPPYPPAAVAVNAQGKVDVQVLIDESGKVVSAKAVSGHPLLRAAAERAAWSARFTPTYLSKVAVKVTGVIVYNFTKN